MAGECCTASGQGIAVLFNDTFSVASPSPIKDASGAPVMNYQPPRLTGVQCLHEDWSEQQEVFGEKQLVQKHSFLTYETSILNGDILITSDNKVVRVNAVAKRQKIGWLEQFYHIDGQEIRAA